MGEETQQIEGLPQKQLSLFGGQEAVDVPKRGRPKPKEREKPPLRMQKVATKLPPIRLVAEIDGQDGEVVISAGRQEEGPIYWERGPLEDFETLLAGAVAAVTDVLAGDDGDNAATVLAEVDIQDLEITE